MNLVMSADWFYPAQMGGPSTAIYWQAKALHQAGYAVTVVATSENLPMSVPLDQWMNLDCGQVIYTRNPHFYLPVKHIWYGWWAIRRADVVHVNSLFYPASVVWVLMSRLLSKPVVWSPHGELSPAALCFRPYLKRFLLTLFRLLSPTVHFHATCAAEVSQIRQHFGGNTWISEIHNRMELPVPAQRTAQPYLLFVGRLHPIKALDQLIIALGQSRPFRDSDYTLKIVGPDTTTRYTRELMELVQTLDLSTKVAFTGSVYGQEKEQLYANARLLVLPSHSENFGNVVIESLAQGTPVVTSIHTPWQLLESERAGHWVHNDPDTLQRAIDQFLSMPSDQYEAYRTRALALARREYDIYTNTGIWTRFYEGIQTRNGL